MVHRRTVVTGVALAMAAATALIGRLSAAAPEIVLYASDVTTLQGHWAKASTSSGAGGQMLSTTNTGWASVNSPLASPSHFFEAPFSAVAGTPYHVWLRVRGTSDSKWNESVWVQFSDATNTSGAAVYRIGTSSALLDNLENCNSCGISGWGWQDGAYWLTQATTLRFTSSGSHTLRIQTREDGVELDQVVLSPSTYLTARPGSLSNPAPRSKPPPNPAGSPPG